MIQHFKTLLAQIKGYLKALHNSQQVYLEARKLKGQYLQLQDDYQALESQLDELLSNEAKTEERITQIRNEYKEILDAYESYHEKMKAYRGAFEHIEYFSDEMQAKAKIQLWALSDTIIDVLVNFLKYYKFDLAQKSLSLTKIDQNQQWRAGSLSTIDAMIIFLNKQRKEKKYTDRVVWERKETDRKINTDFY